MLNALGNKSSLSSSPSLLLYSDTASKITDVVNHKQDNSEENRLIKKEVGLQLQLITTFDAELSNVRKRLISLRRRNT